MMLNMYLLILFMMVSIMLFTPILMSMLMKKWMDKTSSFECGMNLCMNPRKPFSLRFFLLMILFIVFDLEIALILAMPAIYSWSVKMSMFLTLFITILFTGLMYEWTEGSLNWKS
uniref:NADH-ubiquinone oxidoreductase chain 3 n=1 Tax=Olavius algarvensis TaxID=188229 RepID=A0A7R9NFX8_9ANNE|nr:ND3 CDS [Olavius algarvensis]CAD7857584.1 ND3 CDS [Olavius algarvensis]